MGLGDLVGSGFSDVGSIVSTITNPFGAPSAGEWVLTEGSFSIPAIAREVKFFYETRKGQSPTQGTGLEQIQDSGGRRKVVYEYPYRDGQQLGDLGRKGGRFCFNLKFFGSDYQTLFEEFLDVVGNNSQSGILYHPVLGNIPCGFVDYEFIHRYDERNAVTIRATFLEDNFGDLDAINGQAPSSNSGLRSALSMLTDVQSTIGLAISDVSAALMIPGAVKSAMKARLTSITSQLAGLLGQLAATFSTDSHLQSLAAQASNLNAQATSSGGSSLLSVNSGTDATTGQTLPPVFQVGLSPSASAAASSIMQNYLSSNQITPTQAVYQMNQTRAQISSAIADVETHLGCQGADIVLAYRQLAVQFQKTIESCISQSSSSVKIYTLPYAMSARMAGFNNGLSADRQNDIANLNPNLDSLNLIPAGTQLAVPAV